MGRKKGDINNTTRKKILASKTLEEFFKEQGFDAVKQMYFILLETQDPALRINILDKIAKYTHVTKDKQQDSTDNWAMFLKSLENLD